MICWNRIGAFPFCLFKLNPALKTCKVIFPLLPFAVSLLPFQAPARSAAARTMRNACARESGRPACRPGIT